MQRGHIVHKGGVEMTLSRNIKAEMARNNINQKELAINKLHLRFQEKVLHLQHLSHQVV